MIDDQTAARAAFARQRAAMAVMGLSPPEMHVLLILAVMANEQAQCWPAIRGGVGLAAKSGLSDRTISRALRGLEAAGHISTHRIEGKGSIYTVHPVAADPCQPVTPDTVSPLTECQATPDTVSPKQPRTTNRYTGECARDPIEIVPDLPAGTDPARWFEYAEMRSAMAKGPKGRPWTPGAQSAALRTLNKLHANGHPADAVLEQSVLNGWQGLFELKDTGHDPRSYAGSRRGGGTTTDAYLEAFRRVSAGEQPL